MEIRPQLMIPLGCLRQEILTFDQSEVEMMKKLTVVKEKNITKNQRKKKKKKTKDKRKENNNMWPLNCPLEINPK